MDTLPSLRQLEFLIALDTHGHFAHAAKACGVGASAFSNGLASLEDALGVRVADRDRRTVTMTVVGRRLAAQARVVLAESRTLVALAQADAPPMTGLWRLGSIPTIAPFLMPQLLPAMKALFPELALSLRESKTPDLLIELEQDHLDLLLIAFPYDTPGCETQMLFRDSYLFACSPQCALAAAPSISAHDITGQALMLLEESNCLHHHALPLLETAARAPQATFAGTSLQTLAAMVAVDMGSTLLPRLAVEGGLLRGSDVVTRPLGYAGGQRTLGLCWREGHPRTAEFQRLGTAIRDWSTRQGIGEGLDRPKAGSAGRKSKFA